MLEEFGSQDEVLQEGTLQERREVLLETTREALEEGDLRTLRLILNSGHPADLAELFRHLDEEQQHRALEVLAEPLAAATLAAMDTPERLELTEELGEEALSDLVEEMEPDDAADVLGDLSEEQSRKVLELMEPAGAEEVRELLAHPQDTGGGIMTSRLVALGEDLSVAAAIAFLRQWTETEEIFYLYTVDAEQRLAGTVSLKSLLLASQDVPLSTLARRDPIAVRPEMDQEEIAQIFADYDLLVLPVVDGEGRLVGQVTVDDIVDVIHAEATEDIYEMAAISSEGREQRSVLAIVRRRLPWLLVCLGGTTLAAGVMTAFQGVLARVAALGIFVPAIMAMGGNSGLQSSTVTVRGLATGQLQAGEVWSRIWRELRIALAMGLFVGVAIFALAHAWTGDFLLGGCVGLAMFVAVVLAAVLGALVPLLFHRLGVDPAVASGPLITTLNDALSLLVYFSVAVLLLEKWR